MSGIRLVLVSFRRVGVRMKPQEYIGKMVLVADGSPVGITPSPARFYLQRQLWLYPKHRIGNGRR